MDQIYNAKWIKSKQNHGEAAIIFEKYFSPEKPVKKALLQISALGVYEAAINGERVGDYVFAPGWTSRYRAQYQSYDVTGMIKAKNLLAVELGQGWRMHGQDEWSTPEIAVHDTALIAALTLEYEDGEEKIICTDDNWTVRQSKTRYTNMYNGNVYDAGYEDHCPVLTKELKFKAELLVPQQGEKIAELSSNQRFN